MIGITGNIHLSNIMIKLRRGIRLAQVSECKITVDSHRCFVQLDGEPYTDTRSVYHVRRLHQVPMLVKPQKSKQKYKEEKFNYKSEKDKSKTERLNKVYQ